MKKKDIAPTSPLFHLVATLHGERSGEMLDLLRLLWTVEHHLTRLSRASEERHGISGSHRAVLQYVALFPGISASKLTEILQLHASTLSHVFKRLIASGLVERREDEDDSRKMRLYPTVEGLNVLRLDTGAVDAAISRVVSESDAEWLRNAREVLQRLASALEQEADAHSPAVK